MYNDDWERMNHMKTNHRSLSPSDGLWKRYAWILVPIIGLGGLIYPLLGFAVLAIMVILMVLGMLRGRYWCGNLCPHGSLFDVVLARYLRVKKIPRLFLSPVFKWSFFAFFMVMFVSRVSGAWQFSGELHFTERLGGVFVMQYLMLPTIGAVLLAVIFGPRTWCKICPMGTIQTIMHRLGTRLGINKNMDVKLELGDPGGCRECGACARACPMQLTPYRDVELKGFDQECIQCSNCVNNCPFDLLSMGIGGAEGDGRRHTREAAAGD